MTTEIKRRPFRKTYDSSGEEVCPIPLPFPPPTPELVASLKRKDIAREKRQAYYAANREKLLAKGGAYQVKRRAEIRIRSALYWQKKREAERAALSTKGSGVG